MDHQGILMLNNANYQLWKERMNYQLIALGYDVWNVITNGHGEKSCIKPGIAVE